MLLAAQFAALNYPDMTLWIFSVEEERKNKIFFVPSIIDLECMVCENIYGRESII